MIKRILARATFACIGLFFVLGPSIDGVLLKAHENRVDSGKASPVVPVAKTFVPGEIIVKFVNQPDREIMANVEASLGNNVQWRNLRHAPHAKGMPGTPHPLSYYRIATVAPNADVVALSRRVAALEGVDFASVNNTDVRPTFTPNDPMFGSQWSHQKISSEAAWDISTGDTDIIVGIVDTGCLLNHEDLQDHVWVNDDPVNGLDDDNNGFVDDTFGWDFVNNNNTVDDVFGHGTQVSGISSAGIDNGVGIAGIGNTTFMTAKWWHNSGNDSSIAESAFYCTDNGARVLNMSLSGSGPLPLTEAAVNYAYDNGVVVVASSGNAGGSTPHYPAFYPTVLAVAAININDQRPGFSNYGAHIDVAAPSPGILSTSPQGSTSYTSSFGGTSAAAPHVAGLVGLMLSVNPSLTPDEVRTLLHQNADDVGEAGFDIFFGNGRINCAATVAAIPSAAICAGDGTLIEGFGETDDYNATCGSDDSYWAAHGDSLFFQVSDPVVQFELTATVPAGISGGTISVGIEASKQSDLANLNLRALLFNFATGSYVSLPGIMPLAITDAVQNFALPGGADPADFIGPNNEAWLLLQTIQTSGLPNVRTQLDEVLFNFE